MPAPGGPKRRRQRATVSEGDGTTSRTLEVGPIGSRRGAQNTARTMGRVVKGNGAGPGRTGPPAAEVVMCVRPCGLSKRTHAMFWDRHIGNTATNKALVSGCTRSDTLYTIGNAKLNTVESHCLRAGRTIFAVLGCFSQFWPVLCLVLPACFGLEYYFNRSAFLPKISFSGPRSPKSN